MVFLETLLRVKPEAWDPGKEAKDNRKQVKTKFSRKNFFAEFTPQNLYPTTVSYF